MGGVFLLKEGHMRSRAGESPEEDEFRAEEWSWGARTAEKAGLRPHMAPQTQSKAQLEAAVTSSYHWSVQDRGVRGRPEI